MNQFSSSNYVVTTSNGPLYSPFATEQLIESIWNRKKLYDFTAHPSPFALHHSLFSIKFVHL